MTASPSELGYEKRRENCFFNNTSYFQLCSSDMKTIFAMTYETCVHVTITTNIHVNTLFRVWIAYLRLNPLLLILLTYCKITWSLVRNMSKDWPVINEDKTFSFSHPLNSLRCVFNECFVSLNSGPNLLVWWIPTCLKRLGSTCRADYSYLVRRAHDVVKVID